MGYIQPDSMKLRDFLKDSLAKTGDQIRESARIKYESSAVRQIADIESELGLAELSQFTAPPPK